jgi:hypothetical protein
MPKSKQRKKKPLTQTIKVPTTIKRVTEDGKIVLLPNPHYKAGKTLHIQHKPKVK